jgi:hypothetical protein
MTDTQAYRKKPVTIDAIQWTGENLHEVICFTDGHPDIKSDHAGMRWEEYKALVARDGLKIFTLEGVMNASPGDWIIRGVKGELYPCKPDIFELTYEPASARAPDPRIAELEAENARLRETGAFLLGRLDELEWHDGQLDETARQYFGHVGPAVYRFRAALGARNDADA